MFIWLIDARAGSYSVARAGFSSFMDSILATLNQVSAKDLGCGGAKAGRGSVRGKG